MTYCKCLVAIVWLAETKREKKEEKKKEKKRKKKPIFNKEYCILYVVFIWIRLRRTICRGWIPQTPRIIVNTCYKLHLGYFEPTIPGLPF